MTNNLTPLEIEMHLRELDREAEKLSRLNRASTGPATVISPTISPCVAPENARDALLTQP